MKKFYYLSTCDTCKRIMAELNITQDITLQDIKSHPLSEEDVDKMKAVSQSYESLFSRRARLYKERNLKNKELSETDFKDLILDHYTFLKRPVLLYDDKIFIGNSKGVVTQMKNFLETI